MIEPGDSVEVIKHDILKGEKGKVEEVLSDYVTIKIEGKKLPILIDTKSVKKNEQ